MLHFSGEVSLLLFVAMETFAALCCCYDGIWRVEVVETLFHKTTAKSKSHLSKANKSNKSTHDNRSEFP
jgi:hypothetical protein